MNTRSNEMQKTAGAETSASFRAPRASSMRAMGRAMHNRLNSLADAVVTASFLLIAIILLGMVAGLIRLSLAALVLVGVLPVLVSLLLVLVLIPSPKARSPEFV